MKPEVVVEWSKGRRERWEWRDGAFTYRREGVAAPVNYGFLPDVLNPADGEEVDAVVLGPPLPPKSRTRAPLVGLLWLADGDHKLVLAPGGGPYLEDEAALLAWFEPERRARLECESAAREWLEKLGYQS
ncbi:hypothetical protein Ocepr_1339 [Oceanithermus profundus DSM 14977]|uniref:inorganic diphosphatase n=1 Tax=Oceanithermus profundus (strain DSM 14977 / NBRC 100410 / VKM B-2274 / 506) TaxID=670487 RepID=E4U8W6_OCEP5|nr:inorganic diphosphatase [Oceanithermus profundus]ADR36796.1 hypothetical protein Ocepr_1339 [Oceanithermus profundus DSM 14977]